MDNDEKYIIKTPLGITTILIFWIVTFIYFVLVYNISIEKGFSFKLLGIILFFEGIIYLVTVMNLRIYKIYNDKIEIFAPYSFFNRKYLINIVDIQKIIYFSGTPGAFRFYLKNGVIKTICFNTYFFVDDKFKDVIIFFKSKNISLYRRKIFNIIVPFDCNEII